MAADESLLRSAVERRVAALRFYTWTEPTLSLGYFQPHADRLNDPPLCAVALPAGPPWHTAESWICRFHHAVTAALGHFGVRARSVVCGEEKKLGPFLCFLHQTPGDLLVEGHKVVGSAQRRPHGSLLQHGSILLRRSEHAPELPGIEDMSRVAVPGSDLEHAIVTELVAATGWTFEPGEWTGDERRHAAGLEREKYGASAWNTRR
jgi:lipoate-protein ligase A